MDGRRDGTSVRRVLATLMTLMVGWAGAGVGRAADDVRGFDLSDAGQSGAFTVGPAAASLRPLAGRTGFVLDVHLPPGTAAGAWFKGFPAAFRAGSADQITARVARTSNMMRRARARVALEIKGTGGTQRIPLALRGAPVPGGSSTEVRVDWGRIGAPTEVVVSIATESGHIDVVEGEFEFDVSFAPTPWATRLAESALPQLAAALGASVLLALVGGLIGRSFARRGAGPTGPTGAERDMPLGAALVATLVLGVAVFDLGAWPSVDLGRWAVIGPAVAAAAGGGIAALWAWGLGARPLTMSESGRASAITGLLAATVAPVAVLQVPAAWGDAFRLSQFAAGSTVVIYHLMNARSLATTGRALGGMAAGLIAATPFVLGALALLASNAQGLMGRLGGDLSGGLLADRPEWAAVLGRLAVLWGFNEAVAAGLGLATKGRIAGSIRLHAVLLLAALLAVLAPAAADLGSSPALLGWPPALRAPAAVVGGALAEAGLWAEVYLVTGLLLDAVAGFAPTGAAGQRHVIGGLGKALVYAGVFLAILWGIGGFLAVPAFVAWAQSAPVLVAVPVGALLFPLAKTIIETFDGSQGFFRRVARSGRDPGLYARGAVVGLGVGVAVARAAAGWDIPERSLLGFAFGALAYAGVNLVRDGFEAAGNHGRVQPARAYLVQSLLGGAIGAGLGFYFDAAQVAKVVAKFWQYLAVGHDPVPFDALPFLSKWGHVDLGTYAGGSKLLFDESLRGVMAWAIPAWLFALNRTFMAAYFQGEAGPIRGLLTPEGRAAVGRNMIEVLRWGLWMAPIIESFLRPTGTPTWYNQDGAIRTLVAIGHDATEPAADFRAWSLGLFTALLAYDWLRVLIWLDHYGLRVATLVNLSFLGMDRLDAKLARFLRPASTARCIPEGVKRFTTWAPLLLPFYIPTNIPDGPQDWDTAWNRSGAGNPPAVVTLGWGEIHRRPAGMLGLAIGLVAASSGGFAGARVLGNRRAARQTTAWTLTNPEYSLTIEPSGAITSVVKSRGYDLTRRSYDTLDPCGRALFLAIDEGGERWYEPLLGQFPGGNLGVTGATADPDEIAFRRGADGLTADVRVSLPDPSGATELWTIDLTPTVGSAARWSLVPYLEWVLNRPDADRGHTQYNRLFAEMEYVPGLNAVLAWDKHSKALGFLATDVTPSGFLTSRMDFIGRAGSLRAPSAVETMAFTPPEATEAHPTFDPIAALRIDIPDGPVGQPRTVRLLIGHAADKAGAIALIARHLGIAGAEAVASDRRRKALHSIGHGAIPPGTPQPYSEFSEDGRSLRVLTPFTPRPVDHVLSNALGHVVALTNRGFQTTSSGNSQQNRLTPDWPDTVTREVPPEAFYLFEPATGAWFSPTFHPLNDTEAVYETVFGVNGTATYAMTRGDLATELTVFVPPVVPAGVYHLTIRNASDRPRTLHAASYFQIVMSSQPEAAGPLRVRPDGRANALFFENPRNTFQDGPAFAATSVRADAIETSRARFFGPAGDVTRPAFVAGVPVEAANPGPDNRPVAAFLQTLTVPPRGETSLTVVLGQSSDRRGIAALLKDLQVDPDFAGKHLAATRKWWLGLMDTVRVTTSEPEFDRYLDWIRYQALAERIWARRGFYQASGAFGFRDQLQDSVNLMWMDPGIARTQILLHASQQFVEGDVVHWFHRLGDGRTGFAARTHASDNLLWLGWATVEYVAATGDHAILDETTPYLESELPFGPLPKDKGGMGFDPLRSSRADTLYRHCLRAIDLVLDHKMGAHGLPLIGTGDWNDGLDEIGAEGRGESVWLGFFLHYILERMANIVGQKEGEARRVHYLERLRELGEALDSTWRDDRYLRAIHDDGTEIGVRGSGVWEIDALTAAWAVMANINPLRGRIVFETALEVLEKDTTILLGWPPLREDTHPYLGRSSGYPEGVRENGMYCHGVQWLVGAARLLAEQATADGRPDDAARYAATAYRLWHKIASIHHTRPDRIETFGGQPNKQSADMVTTFDPGRMIWHGYTGAAGWMFRQAIEGVLGRRLIDGAVVHPQNQPLAPELGEANVTRDITRSPFADPTPSEARP